MFRRVSRLLSDASKGALRNVTSTMKEPDQIADWINEQMIHQVINKLPGLSEAASYDLSGNVKRRTDILTTRLSERRLEQLLHGESRLHLDSWQLDDFDSLVISRAIRFINQSAQLLDLSKNPDSGDVGAGHIAKHVVPHATGLTALFMSGCSITDAGLSVLSSSLHFSKSIGILELRNNLISDSGSVELADALAKNPYARNLLLYLSGNMITDEGATALAKLAITKDVKIWLKDSPGISKEFQDEVAQYTSNLRF